MAESTVLLLKEVHEEAAPIERQELSEVLNQNILSEASNADIVNHVLQHLQKVSSLHRFAVSLNTISVDHDVDSLDIKSTVGAVWDKKDGLYNFKIDVDGKIYLFTVLWFNIS